MSMNKNHAKGRVKEVEGMIKEVAGMLAGNETREEEGTVQKILGEARPAVSDLKQDVKNAVKNARPKLFTLHPPREEQRSTS